MPGFSFSCPDCGKTYENVKAEMAGRKVRCSCGKVFRLGPKTEEQLRIAAERKARKLARLLAAEKEKSRRTIPATAKLHSGSGSRRTTNPLAPILKNRENQQLDVPIVAELAEDDDEVYVAQPVEPIDASDGNPEPCVSQPVAENTEDEEILVAELDESQVDVTGSISVAQPLVAEIVEDSSEAVVVESHKDKIEAIPVGSHVSTVETASSTEAYSDQDVLSELPEDHLFSGTLDGPPVKSPRSSSRRALSTPAPSSKRDSSTEQVGFEFYRTNRLRLWTLGYSFPAAFVQLSVAFGFLGQTLRDSSMAMVITTRLAGLIALLLAAAVFISGIYAIFEFLNKKKPTSWPTTVAGYVGGASIASLAALTVCSIVTGDRVGSTILNVAIAAVVPLAAIVTGYVRSEDETIDNQKI